MSKRLGYFLIPVDLLVLFFTYQLAFAVRAVAISLGILTRVVTDPYPTIPHHALFLIVTQLLALRAAGLYNTSSWRFDRSFPRTLAALFGQVLALTFYTLSLRETLWLVPIATFWILNTAAVASLRGLVHTFLLRVQPQLLVCPPTTGNTPDLLEAVPALLATIRQLEQECDAWVTALDEANRTAHGGKPKTVTLCREGYNRARKALVLKRLELTRTCRRLEGLCRRLVKDLRKAEDELELERVKRSSSIAPDISNGTQLRQEKGLEELRQRGQRAQELMTLCLPATGAGCYGLQPDRLRMAIQLQFEALCFRWVRLPFIPTYRVIDFFIADSARVFIVGFMVLLMICAGLLAAAPFATGIVRWWAGSGLWITTLGPLGNIQLPSGKTLNQRLASLKEEGAWDSLIAQSVISSPFQWLAEQIADIAYLFLVIGVGMKLYQLVRAKNAPSNESGKP